MATNKMRSVRRECNPLTAARLREVMEYDPQTGRFKWRRCLTNNPYAGRPAAGCVSKAGYVKIRIDYRLHYAHRLAWLYVHGEWPTRLLDHVNGNRSDNRLCNLREANDVENTYNKPAQSNNTTGFKGVSLIKSSGRYRATINNRHLGVFDTAERASDAYQIAAASLHGEFAPRR